jgi:anti-sigma factor RsiW
MSKHLTDTQLHDLCDEALTESECRALRQHLDGCARCRDRVVRLESLLASAAAAPTKIPPPEDLWPSLRDRIETAKVAAITEEPPAQPWWAKTGVALGAAAVLVLVTATVTAVLVTPEPRGAVPEAATVPVARWAEVSLLIADYQGLTNSLAREFARQRDRLPPEAVATVEVNLRVIDAALAEIGGVIAQEPHNATLLELLATIYRQKVSVLEHATESIS